MAEKYRRRKSKLTGDHHIEDRPTRYRVKTDLLSFELLHKLWSLARQHRRDHAIACIARGKADFALELRLQQIIKFFGHRITLNRIAIVSEPDVRLPIGRPVYQALDRKST